MAGRFKSYQDTLDNQPPTEDGQVIPLEPQETPKSNRFQRAKPGEGIPPPPSSIQFEKETLRELNKLPWYKKLGRIDQDLGRMAGIGATYGAMDNPNLLPEEELIKNAQARIRSGWLGTGAEIAGGVVSPITRLIGMGGKAIGPAAEATGILPWLSRIGVGAGEGATAGVIGSTLHGNPPEDLASEGITGAAIGGAIPALSPMAKPIASWLSGKPREVYSTVFGAGREGGTVSQAAKEGLTGKPSRISGETFKQAEATWQGQKEVPFKPIADEAKKQLSKQFTSTKHFKGDLDSEYTRFKKIGGIINDAGVVVPAPKTGALAPSNVVNISGPRKVYTVENLDAARRQLQPFAKRASKASGAAAIEIQKAIKNEIEKVQPGYVDALGKYSRGSKAYLAGKKLKDITPGSFNIPSVLANLLFAGGAYFNPAFLAGNLGATIGSSPKLGGELAYQLGKGRGMLDKLGVSPGSVAYQIYLANEREREARKKLNKK